MRQAVAPEGLALFKLQDAAGGAAWSDPFRWPHLTIAADQGSDGMAAYWYLQHCQVNCMMLCDWSHGAWADTKGMLRDMGLFPWWLLMMVTLNLAHGPFNDDVRYTQLNDAWSECARHLAPERCALYQQHVGSMVDEMSGAIELSGEAPSDGEIWRAMSGRPALLRKGYKVNLNRFFGGTQTARRDLSTWHWQLFVLEYVGLESGMLATKKQEKFQMRVPAQSVDENEGRGPTDASRFDISEKAVKDCCQNSLVLAATMRGDMQNNYIMRCVLTVVEPLEAWHGTQAHLIRSVGAGVDWQISQHKRDFGKHLCDILGKLLDPSALEFCRFSLPGSKASIAKPNSEDLIQETDFAMLFAGLAVCLVSKRIQRCLWFWRGWPARMTAILDSTLAGGVLQQFKSDLVAYEAWKSEPERSSAMNSLIARSVFRQVSVQQLAKVWRCVVPHFETSRPSPPLVKLLAVACGCVWFRSGGRARRVARLSSSTYGAIVSYYLYMQADTNP